jgi:hypothetical protein
MKQGMGRIRLKRGAISRGVLVTATLGWLAVVVSGCAVTKAAEAPTSVQPVQQAGSHRTRMRWRLSPER